MGLIHCAECSKPFSSRADTCPHCGVKTPHASRVLNWRIAALLALVLAAWFAWSHHRGEQKRLADQKAYQTAIEASQRFQDSQRK